jgi:hypothetical protein
MAMAEINLGDIVWSMFMFFFFVIFLWMIFGIIGDVFRSDDLGGVAKMIWCIAIIFFPFLAIFVYLIVRGSGMGERSVKASQKAQAQFDSYVRETAGPSGPAAEIKSAKELLDSGAITQAEFDHIKSKALASA